MGAHPAAWQLLVVTIVSYLIFIATASLAVWLAFKSNGFTDSSTQTGLEVGTLVLLLSSLILPSLYYVYMDIWKGTRPGAGQEREPGLSRTSTIIIISFTYVFMVITSSLGIWMANANSNWSSHTESDAVQVTFIVVLVLALVLPFLYFIYVKRLFCKEETVVPAEKPPPRAPAFGGLGGR